MTEAYDLRSNIKGKPGSQGTLFQVTGKSALNPTLRWPRGYTPERQAEVHEAMSRVAVSHPDHMEDEHEPGDYKDIYGYRPRVLDTIARSTVPVEHLKGLSHIHGEPEPGTDGTYWPSRKEVAIDMTHPEAEENLIHELGHHADAQHLHTSEREGIRLGTERAKQKIMDDPYTRRNPNIVHPETGEITVNGTRLVNSVREISTGIGEGVADNYMVEHYRTRSRNPQPVEKGAYEKSFTRDHLDTSYPGYSEMRPGAGPLNARQFTETDRELPGMRDWRQNEENKRWFQQ